MASKLQRAALCAVGWFAFAAAPGLHGQMSDEQDRALRESLRKITEVYQLVNRNLAQRPDAETALNDGAIRGVLASLDPFSTYLNTEQFQSFQQQQHGVEKGFGATLNVQSGSVIVLESVPNSPFGRAGIGPGDRLVRINGQRIASMDLREIVDALQQARSDRVHLSVLQSGKVIPRDFDLSPAEIAHDSVDKKFLMANNVAYAHVAEVEQNTPAELRNALDAWKARPPRALVLDLRDNPGGDLDAAVALVSLFLSRGLPVVSLQGRSLPARTYAVESAPLWRDLPLVVIINGRSASAAEIIAAALQEHDRAFVVGEPSFGKGVVESVMTLSGGAALALTTAQYLTPKGRSVQRPVPGTALADMVNASGKVFHTDSGRQLNAGGGVHPDRIVEPRKLDEWAGVLSESTGFINFAQSYIELHGKVAQSFEVDEAVLGEFRRFLERSGLVVPARSWNAAVPFLKVRIKTELFNLVFGASRGDQVEMQGDPQVQGAIRAIEDAARLLAAQTRNQTTAGAATP